MPPPSPVAMPIRPTAHARHPAGISSAAITPIRISRAATRLVATTWLAVSQASDGATAPDALDDRTGERREQDEPAPSAVIGEDEQHEGQEDVDPNQPEGNALPGLANAELLGGVGHGQAEQGAEVADDHSEGCQGGEYHRRPTGHPLGWRPPRWTVYRPQRAEGPPERQGEQPGEIRNGERKLDGLTDADSTVVERLGAHLAAVGPQRPLLLFEAAGSHQALFDQSGPRAEDGRHLVGLDDPLGLARDHLSAPKLAYSSA